MALTFPTMQIGEYAREIATANSFIGSEHQRELDAARAEREAREDKEFVSKCGKLISPSTFPVNRDDVAAASKWLRETEDAKFPAFLKQCLRDILRKHNRRKKQKRARTGRR